MFSEISSCAFLFMLILLAKGYTVTRGRLRKATQIKIGIFFILYIVGVVISFILAEAVS